jgi:hypothetical protein
MLYQLARHSSVFLASLCFCLSSVTAASAQSADDRRIAPIVARKQLALVIGNASYSNHPLVNSVNDAQSMADRLRQLAA